MARDTPRTGLNFFKLEVWGKRGLGDAEVYNLEGIGELRINWCGLVGNGGFDWIYLGYLMNKVVI